MVEWAQNQFELGNQGLSLQIPIFYKLMASMLFVAIIPVGLLGLVFAGDAGSVVAVLGLQNSILLMTFVTLGLVVMWSFFLAKSITGPIEQLSQVATSVSRGDLDAADITVTSNDEIGELAAAFRKLVNAYRVLDTLAKEDS